MYACKISLFIYLRWTFYCSKLYTFFFSFLFLSFFHLSHCNSPLVRYSPACCCYGFGRVWSFSCSCISRISTWLHDPHTDMYFVELLSLYDILLSFHSCTFTSIVFLFYYFYLHVLSHLLASHMYTVHCELSTM